MKRKLAGFGRSKFIKSGSEVLKKQRDEETGVA